jgi:hypothetical protein
MFVRKQSVPSGEWPPPASKWTKHGKRQQDRTTAVEKRVIDQRDYELLETQQLKIK